MKSDLASVQNEGVKTLTAKKIFFGHASVGNNIIDGIRDVIVDDQRLQSVNIVKLSSGYSINGPGIYHDKNGKNGYPRIKIDAFKKRIENGLGENVDIAFFKLCYVDINKETDVKEIFNYYSETMDNLKKTFPSVTFVHVTTPLYAHAWGLKGFIKNLLRGDPSNIKRNKYNELLRNKYEGNDPIYDLAALESTLPDGKRASFTHEGEEFYALAKQYTYDGGHLNETGRYLAARELLRVLSEISLKQDRHNYTARARNK